MRLVKKILGLFIGLSFLALMVSPEPAGKIKSGIFLILLVGIRIAIGVLVHTNRHRSIYYKHPKTSAEYERSKMSPSLRYDILKRDNFCCQLCGRSTRKHGVELEVDHIIPVSKGGKTEWGNLRTLCKDCNRGKGAKYDPYGWN